MRSWDWHDLDRDFLRGVRSRLSPGWFWDVDDVPLLLEGIALEIRERLRKPGDRLLFPGLGEFALEESTPDGGGNVLRVRLVPASDWRIGEGKKE